MKDNDLRKALGYREDRNHPHSIHVHRETDLDKALEQLKDIREFLGIEYSAPEVVPSKLVPKPKRTMKIPK